jgi:nicotinamidase-related amidase
MNSSAVKAHSRRALLLIDFQRDFLEADGRMPVARAQVSPVLDAARRALGDARKAGDLVVAIGNEFRPGDVLMNVLRRYASIAGAPGAQWTEHLPLDGVPYFPKWAESAFVNPDLDAWLRDYEVKTLALAGLKANACISSTAKEAMRRGYKVEILADAIACGSDRSRTRALSRLKAKGAALLRAA